MNQGMSNCVAAWASSVVWWPGAQPCHHAASYERSNHSFAVHTSIIEYPSNQDWQGSHAIQEAYLLAMVIHLWLLFNLGARLYMWNQAEHATDATTGGYLRFCVEVQLSSFNTFTVYCSCIGCFLLAIASLMIAEWDSISRLWIMSALLMFVGLKAQLTVPQVVIDMANPAFIQARFDWPTVWLSGGHAVVHELGRIVVTGDRSQRGRVKVKEGNIRDFTLLGKDETFGQPEPGSA